MVTRLQRVLDTVLQTTHFRLILWYTVFVNPDTVGSFAFDIKFKCVISIKIEKKLSAMFSRILMPHNH